MDSQNFSFPFRFSILAMLPIMHISVQFVWRWREFVVSVALRMFLLCLCCVRVVVNSEQKRIWFFLSLKKIRLQFTTKAKAFMYFENYQLNWRDMRVQYGAWHHWIFSVFVECSVVGARMWDMYICNLFSWNCQKHTLTKWAIAWALVLVNATMVIHNRQHIISS